MLEFITPVSALFSLFFVVPLLIFLLNRFAKKRVVFSHFIIGLLKKKTIFKLNILSLIIRILCILFLILAFAGLIYYRDNDGLRRDNSFVVAINNNANLAGGGINRLSENAQEVINLLLKNQVEGITVIYNTPFKAEVDTVFSIEDFDGVRAHIPVVYREDFFANLERFIGEGRKIIYLDDRYRTIDSENVFFMQQSPPINLNIFDTVYYSQDTLHIHTQNIENAQFHLSSVYGRVFNISPKKEGESYFAINLPAGWYEIKETTRGVRYYFMVVEYAPPQILNIYTDDVVKGELIAQFFSVMINTVINPAEQVYFQAKGNAIYYALRLPDFSRISPELNATIFPIDTDSLEFFHINPQVSQRGKFARPETVLEFQGFRPKFPFTVERKFSFRAPTGFEPSWVSQNSGRALSYRKGNIELFTFDPDTSNSSFLVNPLFIKYFEDYFRAGKSLFKSEASNRTIVRLGNTTVTVAGVKYDIRDIGNFKGEIENFFFEGTFFDDINNTHFFVNPSYREPQHGYIESVQYAKTISSVNDLNRYFNFVTYKKIFLVFAILLFALDSYFARRYR